NLYGNIFAAIGSVNETDTGSEESFAFGPTAVVKASQVFYRTAHTIAFVNHRPILAGHVLVSSIRAAKRLQELNEEEIRDLFCTVQKVQKAVESEFGANASTIAIQDGVDAGQSIEHIHAHVIPRKPTDFGGNIDQIYSELQKHDKSEHISKTKLRTDEEMLLESTKLKTYF
ncbi:unnamed protein product, partial [Medioppia subpectinata]